MFDRLQQLNRRRVVERWVRCTCAVTWFLLLLVWLAWVALS